MLELRKHDRELTLKTAKIRYEGAAAPIDCAVLNVSRGGACVLLASTDEIPNTFDLVFDPGGETRTCSVAWRSKFKIGVWFR